MEYCTGRANRMCGGEVRQVRRVGGRTARGQGQYGRHSGCRGRCVARGQGPNWTKLGETWRRPRAETGQASRSLLQLTSQDLRGSR